MHAKSKSPSETTGSRCWGLTNTTINAGKVFRFDQFGNFYFENFKGLVTPVRMAAATACIVHNL